MTYRLNDIFTVIADSNRRAILDLVNGASLNGSEIAEHFEMSRTAVDKHLRILIDTGLISVEKKGRSHTHTLNAQPMKEVWEWLSPYSVFWSTGLNRLKEIAEAEQV